MPVAIDKLKPIAYLKTEHLTHGRTLKPMPFWDGTNWHMWLDTPAGLIEAKIVETVEGDYVATQPAKETDLFIPFVDLMWQRISWPDICPLITAISDDFHNMGTSSAKLRHFFDCRGNLAPGSALRCLR